MPLLVFSLLGLVGFPIGTLINAYILYIVFSAKGKLIFSDEYRKVIQLTPHIKYKTPILIWGFIVLVVIMVLLALVIPSINSAMS